jgi:hypothetical protein
MQCWHDSLVPYCCEAWQGQGLVGKLGNTRASQPQQDDGPHDVLVMYPFGLYNLSAALSYCWMSVLILA